MAKLGVVLTPRAVTYVNLIAIWISFPICACISNKGNNYLPAAITWGTAILNVIGGHLLPLLQKEYVPGAFQSALMVPFGIWVLSSYHFRFGWMDGLILPLIAPSRAQFVVKASAIILATGPFLDSIRRME